MMSSFDSGEPGGDEQTAAFAAAAPEHRTPDAVAPGTDSAQARVGAARRALETLATRPLTEHATVYEEVHEELRAVLADIDGA